MKKLLAKLMMLGLLAYVLVPVVACSPAHEEQGQESAQEQAAPADETTEEAGAEGTMDEGMAGDEGGEGMEGMEGMDEGGDEGMMEGEGEGHEGEGGDGESEPEM